MLLRDLKLFLGGISGELNHLHAVQERGRDRIRRIGRTDEHDVGKVIRHIHVVIREGVILLRIEDLEKCAGRIAVVALGELVDLVEHHDRIGDAALLDAVHDAAGHRADVGSAVAADIRLIPHAAEAHTDIFAPECPGDRLTDTGFAGAGRADEQQDGACLLLLEIHDRNLLDDALLDLLQTVMILVQHLLRLIEIHEFWRLRLPGQRRDKIQIVVEHAVLLRLLSLLSEPVQNLLGLLPRRLVHAGLRDLLLELLHVGHILRVHTVKFLLQILHLLADGRLTVLVLILLLLTCVGLAGDARHFKIFVKHLGELLAAGIGAILREHCIALLTARGQPWRQAARQRRDRVHWFHELPDELRKLRVCGEINDLLLQGLELLIARRLVEILNVVAPRDRQINRAVRIDADMRDIHPVLRDDTYIALLTHLADHPGDADRIETVLCPLFLRLILFQNQQHNLFSDCKAAAGDSAELIRLKIHFRIRKDNLVIGRNDQHNKNLLKTLPGEGFPSRTCTFSGHLCIFLLAVRARPAYVPAHLPHLLSATSARLT